MRAGCFGWIAGLAARIVGCFGRLVSLGSITSGCISVTVRIKIGFLSQELFVVVLFQATISAVPVSFAQVAFIYPFQHQSPLASPLLTHSTSSFPARSSLVYFRTLPIYSDLYSSQ